MIPQLSRHVDERFLTHRLRSTSYAGLAGALTAGVLFEWRLYFERVISRDLLIVIVAMVIVKLTFMVWYRFTD